MEATDKSEEQRKKDAINTQIQKDLHKAEKLSEASKKGLAEGVYPELSHSVCLSICLSINLSVYPSVSFHMFVFFCLSIHLSVSICLSLTVCLSICLFPCLSHCVCLSICLFLYVCHHMFIHLPLLSVTISLQLSGCHCLSFPLSICPSFCLSICNSFWLVCHSMQLKDTDKKGLVWCLYLCHSVFLFHHPSDYYLKGLCFAGVEVHVNYSQLTVCLLVFFFISSMDDI